MTQRLVCVKDFEDYATSHMDRTALVYYNTGANDEDTLKDNVDAFRRYKFRPRVLRDVSNIDMSTTVLGDKIDMPICVAPTGSQCLAHPDGEMATAKAAQQFGTLYAMSMGCQCTMDDVMSAAPTGLKWLNVYVVAKNRSITLDLIRQAEEAGFKAIATTVDSPAYQPPYIVAREGLVFPRHLSFKFMESTLESNNIKESGKMKYADLKREIPNPQLTLDVIKWFRSYSRLKLVLKGIITVEDAVLAVEAGIDGIYVSNHGGRCLDGVPATIDVLSDILDAVDDKCEVYVDGGVRSGLDVLKLLALGAKAVFVGRSILWALSNNGNEGVCQLLNILRKELKTGMALLGPWIFLGPMTLLFIPFALVCNQMWQYDQWGIIYIFGVSGVSRLEQLNKNYVVHESYYHQPYSRPKL